MKDVVKEPVQDITEHVGTRALRACDKDEYRLELIESACMVGWLALRHADTQPVAPVQRTVFDDPVKEDPEAPDEEPPLTKADVEAGLQAVADYVAAKRAGNAEAAKDAAATAKAMAYRAAFVSPTCGFVLASVGSIDDAQNALRMAEASAKMDARRHGTDPVRAVQLERTAMDTIADTVLEQRQSRSTK